MEIHSSSEYEHLIKSLEDIIYLVDENYNFLNIWTSDESKLIIPKNDFLGKNLIDVFGEDFGRKFCDLIDATIKTKNSHKIEYKRPYGHASNKWHKVKINYVTQKNTSTEVVTMVVREIHQEKLLNEKNKLFENIISNNWDAIVFANMSGIVEYVNEAANRLYGYSENELIGQNVDIFNSRETYNTNEIVSELTNKGYWHGELIQRKKDNSTFDALLSVQIISNSEGIPIGFFSNSKNITEDKETARNLKRIIEEKEILLKELHHRVKNNLSIIKGILNLQVAQSKNEIETKLITEFQNRVSAIATLHNTLFDSKDLDQLDFGIFINDLCRNFSQTFENSQRNIQLQISADDYTIPFSTAIPLGLIVNEVLTNSYKHAFGFNGEGIINVQLQLSGKDAIIKVADNGIGFNFEQEKDSSLGISLIEGLTSQVGGEFSYKNNDGTIFELVLPSQS